LSSSDSQIVNWFGQAARKPLPGGSRFVIFDSPVFAEGGIYAVLRRSATAAQAKGSRAKFNKALTCS